MAAIQPAGGDEGLLLKILPALLTGGGMERGVALDTAHPDRPFSLGLPLSPSALHEAAEELVRAHAAGLPCPGARFFGDSRPASDPRVIPITAGDETLALLVLPEPPAEQTPVSMPVENPSNRRAKIPQLRAVFECERSGPA